MHAIWSDVVLGHARRTLSGGNWKHIHSPPPTFITLHFRICPYIARIQKRLNIIYIYVIWVEVN